MALTEALLLNLKRDIQNQFERKQLLKWYLKEIITREQINKESFEHVALLQEKLNCMIAQNENIEQQKNDALATAQIRMKIHQLQQKREKLEAALRDINQNKVETEAAQLDLSSSKFVWRKTQRQNSLNLHYDALKNHEQSLLAKIQKIANDLKNARDEDAILCALQKEKKRANLLAISLAQEANRQVTTEKLLFIEEMQKIRLETFFEKLERTRANWTKSLRARNSFECDQHLNISTLRTDKLNATEQFALNFVRIMAHWKKPVELAQRKYDEEKEALLVQIEDTWIKSNVRRQHICQLNIREYCLNRPCGCDMRNSYQCECFKRMNVLCNTHCNRHAIPCANPEYCRLLPDTITMYHYEREKSVLAKQLDKEEKEWKERLLSNLDSNLKIIELEVKFAQRIELEWKSLDGRLQRLQRKSQRN